jgi:hypothetical protein
VSSVYLLMNIDSDLIDPDPTSNRLIPDLCYLLAPSMKHEEDATISA